MRTDASAVAEAARTLAAHGLCDAFGHVSLRVSNDELVITPPRPLDSILPSGEDTQVIDVRAGDLPAGAPREAWIHTAIAMSRPDVRAICRAQPREVAVAMASRVSVIPLDGHGAMLGSEVPVHDNSLLVRDAASGAEVARTLGDGCAVLLRGNGAVTVGSTLAEAVARMWLLARSAELNNRARAMCEPRPLPSDEQRWWYARSAELLPRIYDYLRNAS